MAFCNANSFCIILHDYGSDGGDWRYHNNWSRLHRWPSCRQLGHYRTLHRKIFSLSEATEFCNADSLCIVLHEFDCDNHGWHYCTSSLQTIQNMDMETSACPRVGNSVLEGTVPRKIVLYNKLGHFAPIICCAHDDRMQLRSSHFMPHGGFVLHCLA